MTVDKRNQHIQKRREHGLTVRDLGDEFGISKSQAHRIVYKGIQGFRAEEDQEET